MGVVRMHRAIKGIVLADDDINLEKFIVQVGNEEAIVFQNLDIIRNKILGVEGQDLEKETRALFANWKTIRDDPELKRLSLQFIEDSYKAIITVGKHLERLTGATLIVELATPQFDQLNSQDKPSITSKDKENLCEFERKLVCGKEKPSNQRLDADGLKTAPAGQVRRSMPNKNKKKGNR